MRHTEELPDAAHSMSMTGVKYLDQHLF